MNNNVIVLADGTRIRRSRYWLNDAGATEVAFQLFSAGWVWDGNIACKAGREILVKRGYAVRREGHATLTGEGIRAFLLSPRIWIHACRRMARKVRA